MNLMLGGSRAGSSSRPWEPIPIYFVLAMDRDKVAAAIASTHKGGLPYLKLADAAPARIGETDEEFGLRYGLEFVEKLVQLPIRLPRARDADLGPFISSLIPSNSTADLESAQPASSTPETQEEAGVRRDVGRAPSPSPAADALDSRELPEVLRRTAAAFDWTPRRLKIFLNRLRFAVLVASRKGVLREPGAERNSGVTIYQVGKAVALAMEGSGDRDPKVQALLEWGNEESPADFSLTECEAGVVESLVGTLG